MKRLSWKRCLFLFFIFGTVFAAGGCNKKEEGAVHKVRDLDFTVVEEADIPEELLININEKKSQPFKLTYSNENYLYIARGYGSQKSGGYSISVKELFLADNAIYFKTELLGPTEQDLVSQTVTYPYIVTKIEFIDKSVVFR